MNWMWPIAAGFATSSAALLGSAAILVLGARAERASAWLLSFAIGTLLGAATLGLLPEALYQAPSKRMTVLPGAALSFAWSSASHQMVGWLLPLAAGGLVYIALADLVPALHHRRGVGAGFVQMILVTLGSAVIWSLSGLDH